MQVQEVNFTNQFSIGESISNTFAGVGNFLSSVFRLNAKSSAILGGSVILGVLCGIPVISLGSFIFAFVFGAYSASLYISHSAKPANYSDGLVVGTLTGVFASFIQLFMTLILATLYVAFASMGGSAPPKPNNPMLAPNVGMQMLSAIGTFGMMMISSLLLFFPIILLAMAGGLLGVVWFENRVSHLDRVSA